MTEHKAEFDSYSQDYKNLVNQSVNFSGLTVDFFTKGKANFLNAFLENEQDYKILDIGCGTGEIHAFLRNDQSNITGVDVSAESLKIARINNPNNKYISYDGYNLPFEDNTFDMALTICVMHHVSPLQWQHFVNEMVRVVKPQGRVFIFEHNPYNPLTRLAVNRCPFDKDAVLLRSKKVECLLNETNLITCKSDFIFFTPFKHSLFQKLDKLLSWLPLGAQYCTHGRKKGS
ncbi:class I SAM-dependent methyltransferase [Candidatus Finniella inopinata]|uniref:Class I SAM-dependent methyltransferase n=1 Tax=Candidatus Finniella inopinata TaxID=1696036 RepID=A0A4Q7DL60_9PROT|nr:class I SAM-dependent methyltransferase [Candidatus Finniella inopinata]RZI47148.1 class I SAM-dependent methyltransferase [Candidatus Finniella inopinata]